MKYFGQSHYLFAQFAIICSSCYNKTFDLGITCQWFIWENIFGWKLILKRSVCLFVLACLFCFAQDVARQQGVKLLLSGHSSYFIFLKTSTSNGHSCPISNRYLHYCSANTNKYGKNACHYFSS